MELTLEQQMFMTDQKRESYANGRKDTASYLLNKCGKACEGCPFATWDLDIFRECFIRSINK